MTNEDIQRILNDYGQTITIRSVTISTDSTGHTSESTTDKTVTGLVLVVSTDSDEAKEGVLLVGDAILYVNPSDANIAYVINDNRFVYNGNEYKITKATPEQGIQKGDTWSHFEVYGRKIL